MKKLKRTLDNILFLLRPAIKYGKGLLLPAPPPRASGVGKKTEKSFTARLFPIDFYKWIR